MPRRKNSIDSSYSSSESLTSLVSHESADSRSYSTDSEDKAPLFVVNENNHMNVSVRNGVFSSNTDVSNNVVKKRRQREQRIQHKYWGRFTPSPTVDSLKKIIEDFKKQDK